MLLYWLLSGSSWIMFLWHPMGGCTLMLFVSWVFLSRTASHDYTQDSCREPSVWQTDTFCYIPAAAKTICFGVSSLFLPCSSLAVNLCLPFWNGNTSGHADSSRELSKSTSVNLGTLLFWAQSAIWSIANCFWHMCLMLRLDCEHKVLFWALFPVSSWCVSDIEDHFVSAEYEMWVTFHFVSWFWVSAIKDHLHWVSVWDSMSRILL